MRFWEYDFDDLLSLVKEYVVGVWDMHKQKLYGDDLCPSQLQSLADDLQLAGVEGQMGGKLYSSDEGGTDGRDLPVRTCKVIKINSLNDGDTINQHHCQVIIK